MRPCWHPVCQGVRQRRSRRGAWEERRGALAAALPVGAVAAKVAAHGAVSAVPSVSPATGTGAVQPKETVLRRTPITAGTGTAAAEATRLSVKIAAMVPGVAARPKG